MIRSRYQSGASRTEVLQVLARGNTRRGDYVTHPANPLHPRRPRVILPVAPLARTLCFSRKLCLPVKCAASKCFHSVSGVLLFLVSGRRAAA
jgi:hypothetical protein